MKAASAGSRCGVVTGKLSVITREAATPKLPIAEMRGEIGREITINARTISTTPITSDAAC